MNLSPPAPLDSFPNLPLCPSDAPPETVHAQLLLLSDRCHLAFQRHPYGIEQPRRYPVPLQVGTVVKKVDFSYMPIGQPSLKTRSPPRRRPNSARRLRPGFAPGNTERIPVQATPRVSYHADSLNRIGFAPPLPQPVLRCKRRSQLPRDRTPVRPHVLHALPHGYGEGDLYAIADGTNPPAGDALGAVERTTGQHQGRCLMYRQPVSLHELHPANDGTVGRVDLMDLHSLTVAAGDEVRLDLAVAETGQHPAVTTGLPLQGSLLLPEVQLLDDDGLADFSGVLHHAGHRVADESLRLVSVLTVGHQRHPPRTQPVAAGVGLGHGQVVSIQVHADGTALSVRNHRHIHHLGAHEHPPALAVPLEPVADGLAQVGGTRRLLTMLPPVCGVVGIAPQRRQHLLVPVGKPYARNDQVLVMLIGQAIRQP